MTLLIILITLTVLWWLITIVVLSGPNLEQFDNEVGIFFDDHPSDKQAQQTFLASLKPVRQSVITSGSVKKGFHLVREYTDNLSNDLITDSEFISDTVNGVSVEWVIPPNANSRRRILFFHGGAFVMGSAKGHRLITDQLAKLANAVVMSVNYRLLPEHRRGLGIRDAQNAYQWLLENDHQGSQDLELLFVSGDSAGGNLSLMISNWSKQQSLRKPDGIICFSPSTDSTASSPLVKKNTPTDPILGESIGRLAKLPKFIGLWIGLLSMRMNPANPLASPLFGDLSDLPPTLIQASSNELLLGDSIRYTNKAIAAGSDVRLQIWKNQLHDWQLFNIGSHSANEAWSEVGAFIDTFTTKTSKEAA